MISFHFRSALFSAVQEDQGQGAVRALDSQPGTYAQQCYFERGPTQFRRLSPKSTVIDLAKPAKEYLKSIGHTGPLVGNSVVYVRYEHGKAVKAGGTPESIGARSDQVQETQPQQNQREIEREEETLP